MTDEKEAILRIPHRLFRYALPGTRPSLPDEMDEADTQESEEALARVHGKEIFQSPTFVGGPLKYLNITEADIHGIGFTEPCQQLLLAFAMAGYEVPTIEIVAPSFAALPGSHEHTAFDEYTIRIDLTGPEARSFVNPREPGDNLQSPDFAGGFVRFYLQPLLVEGRDKSLPFTLEAVESYLAEIKPLVSEPLADFVERNFNFPARPLPVFVDPRRKRDIHDVVTENLHKLVNPDSVGAVTFSTWMPPDFAAIGSAGTGGDPLANGELPKTRYTTWDFMNTLLLGVVHPVSAFVTRVVSDAAGEWFLSEDAQALDPLAPGGLWVLDPENWLDGNLLDQAPVARLSANPPSDTLEYVRDTYAKVYKGLDRPIYGHETDGSFDGINTFELPDPQDYVPGLPYLSFVNWEIAGVNGANIDKSMIAPIPYASVVAQRLIHPYNNGSSITVYTRRKDPGDDAEEDEGNSYKAPNHRDYVTGSGLQNVLALHKDLGVWASFLSPRQRADRTIDAIERAMSACLIEKHGDSEDAAFANAVDRAVGIEADKMLYNSHLISIFNIFGAGLFSIDHLVGDLWDFDDEEDEEYDVIAHELPDGSIRLSLPDYSHEGILIRLRNGDLGYGLTRGVTWEYVPAVEPDPDPVVQMVRESMDVYWGWPKLVIVAAPGIEVDIQRDWPPAVPVELIRVQNVALVPARGERIDTQRLKSLETVSLADLIDREGIDADESYSTALNPADHPTADERARFKEVFDKVLADPNQPIVSVKFHRAGDRQGLEFGYGGREEDYWPGASRTARVTVTLPQGSGTDRFSYKLVPTLDIDSRLINAGLTGDPADEYEDIDVLRYRLILYATPGVKIDIDDDGIRVGRNKTAIEYRFYEAREAMTWDEGERPGSIPPNTLVLSPNNINNIPQQGQPLEYGKPGDPVEPVWLAPDPSFEGGFAERTSAAPLVWNERPITEKEGELIVWWGQFAADMGIGMIPVVGDMVDITEFTMSLFTGEDRWGRPITNADRAMMLGGMLLPFVSSGALRGLKAAARMNDPTIPAGWLRQIDLEPPG